MAGNWDRGTSPAQSSHSLDWQWPQQRAGLGGKTCTLRGDRNRDNGRVKVCMDSGPCRAMGAWWSPSPAWVPGEQAGGWVFSFWLLHPCMHSTATALLSPRGSDLWGEQNMRQFWWVTVTMGCSRRRECPGSGRRSNPNKQRHRRCLRSALWSEELQESFSDPLSCRGGCVLKV